MNQEWYGNLGKRKRQYVSRRWNCFKVSASLNQEDFIGVGEGTIPEACIHAERNEPSDQRTQHESGETVWGGLT